MHGEDNLVFMSLSVCLFTMCVCVFVHECVFVYTVCEGTDKIFLPLVGPGAFQLPLAPFSHWPAP